MSGFTISVQVSSGAPKAKAKGKAKAKVKATEKAECQNTEASWLKSPNVFLHSLNF